MTNAVEVATTQQVVITEVRQGLVEVAVPSSPRVVEVVTAGPQAGVRIGRVLTDATTSGTLYVGTAPLGSAESAAVWTITRSTFSAAGIRTSRGTATGATWTGRTSHTYS